jgi:hypothetical protein
MMGYPFLTASSQEYRNSFFSHMKRLGCAQNGRKSVQFLADHFNILGVQVQNWMLIAAGIIAVFAAVARITRDRG